MADLVVVVTLAVFFALSVVLVKACDSIIGTEDVAQPVAVESERQAA